MKVAVLIFFLPILAVAQPTTTTSGPCSPIAANNSGSITINCQGISNKFGAQLIDLLNRVAKNQSDAEAMMAKLDGCLQGVKDVREQQAEWRLTDSQRKELRQQLIGQSAKIEVRVIPGYRNASIFGQDLMALFVDSKWNVNPSLVTDYGLNPALVGLVLLVSHADFPEAAFLQKLFPTVGIETKAEVKNDTHSPPADTIWIIVGGKPITAR